MITTALTFYTPASGEQTVWDAMPQVPVVGDTVHFDASGNKDPDQSRAWRVNHVSWVYEAEVWHAEIALT